MQFTLNFKNIAISSVLLLTIAVLVPYLVYILGAIILVYALILIKDKYVVPLSVILFLSSNGHSNQIVRDALNGFNILIILFYFRQHINEIKTKFRSPVFYNKIVVVTILALICSTLFTGIRLSSIMEVVRQIIFFLLIYFYYAFTDEQSKVDLLLKSIVISGVLIAIQTLVDILFSGKPLYVLLTSEVVKQTGLLGNVAGIAGELVLSIAATIYFILNKHTWLRRVFIAAYFIQFFALFLTNSRGGIIALVLSNLLIIFMLRRKLFYRFLISFITILILIGLYAPSVFEFLALYFRTTRILENTRFFLWNISIKIFSDHPFVGSGPGLFKEYIYRYLPVMLGTWEESQIRYLYDVVSIGHSHNFFLFKLAETGIVGLSAALYFLYMAFKTALEAIKKLSKGSEEYSLVIIFICTLIGMIARAYVEVTGLLSNGWITRDLPIWLLFSIVCFYLYSPKEKLENTYLS